MEPAEGPEGADARLRELRERLEQELLQQGEEQCECVLKRKEQHVAEVWRWGGEGETAQTNQPHTLRTAKVFSLSLARPSSSPAANDQDDGAGQRETGCRAEDPQGDPGDVCLPSFYACLLNLPGGPEQLETFPDDLMFLCSDTKEMKKKLEAKRLERIQAMIKVTTDKMAQER